MVEKQKARTPQRSSTVESAWASIRAKATKAGLRLFRSDPFDGPLITYFSVCGDQIRTHRTLAELTRLVRDTRENINSAREGGQ